MVDENRFSGTARTIGGKIEGAVGDMTGDSKMQADGMVDKVAGKAQKAYGQAADTVRDTAGQLSGRAKDYADQASDYGSQLMDQVEEYGDMLAEQVDARPITSVLVALGVGFLLAMVTKPAPKVVYRRR